MGRKPKKPVFEEEYVVKLNYQMADGYWKVGHFETVLVPVTDNMIEKDNHELAEEIAKQRFPGCQIVNVTYC